MPDATEETISQLEKNIQNLKSITTMLSEGKTPEDMLDIVLEGLQPRILDKIDVKFECECCIHLIHLQVRWCFRLRLNQHRLRHVR